MKIKLLAFGIAADLLESTHLEIEVSENCNVEKLKNKLALKFPLLKNIDSYAIAVNESYADDLLILEANDVVAIIPPVSGG